MFDDYDLDLDAREYHCQSDKRTRLALRVYQLTIFSLATESIQRLMLINATRSMCICIRETVELIKVHVYKTSLNT